MRLHLIPTRHPRARRWLSGGRSVVAVAVAGVLAGVMAPVTASAAPGP